MLTQEQIDSFPENVKEIALYELEKMKSVISGSQEHFHHSKYLQWLTDLPWKKSSEDRFNLIIAREILNRDHFGLDQIKKRITEFIAVKKLNANKPAPILCLHGPPGVGKTSIAKNIALALNRKFIRISLGGVDREAAIRGFLRSYAGSLPGKIIQGMKQAQTNNPLILLDELDKIKEDPASALLEALDPEQNNAFMDHYLQIPFDLSKTIFVASVNSLSTIHPALKDRLEIISLRGYIKEEALQIAKQYIIPKQILEHGLDIPNLEINISDCALSQLVTLADEPGIRKLEQFICKILRRIAVNVVEETIESKVQITSGNLQRFIND